MKDKINKYLTQVAKITPNFRAYDKKASLPIYLTQLYEFMAAEVLGVNVVFFTAKEYAVWPTIPNLRKHIAVISKSFQTEPVLVFEKRAPRRLPLLVKNNIAYVYLGNEIYLPFLTLKLRTKEQGGLEVHKPNLIGLPQVIVTHQLIHSDLDRLSVSEIARRLSLPKISVSRALIQLEVDGICDKEIEGRSKRHLFPSKDELWHQLQNKMVNPVRQTMYLDKLPTGLDLVKAGVSSLAEKTLIDDTGEQTFAIHCKKIKDLHLV